MARPRFGLYFGFVFGLHLALQVLGWALADSQGGSKTLWKLLSFPLFYILKSWASVYFWMVGAMNSTLWGLLAGALAEFRLRRKATT